MTDNLEPRKLPPLGRPPKSPGLPKLPTPGGAGAAPAPKTPPPSLPTPGGNRLPPPPISQTVPKLPAASQPQRPEFTVPEPQQHAPQSPPQQSYPQQSYPQQGYPQQFEQQPQFQQSPQQFQPQQQQPNPSWEERNMPSQEKPAAEIEPETETEEEEAEEVPPKRGKRQAKKAPPAKKSKRGTASATKPQKGEKLHPYGGSRRKLLFTQIAIFGGIGLFALLGIMSIVPKGSYLTPTDEATIISKVRTDLGESYFPKEAGEGWAQGFLETYMNYNPETAEERKKQLLTYTTEEVLEKIDITFLSEGEISKLTGKDIRDVKPEDLENSAGITNSKKQKITAGPYLVKKEMFPGDNSAIFSYRLQINSNGWAYVEVPVYYDMNKRALGVSGTPTFRSIIPVAETPPQELSTTFERDKDVENRITPDITQYMQAWVESDQTGIDRFLVKESGDNAVTPQASSGLGNSVKFLGLDSVAVQLKTLPPEDERSSDDIADFNERYVSVVMSVVEPTSGIVYKQNYQLVIKYVNENWFIQDIRNVSVFADKTQEK